MPLLANHPEHLQARITRRPKFGEHFDESETQALIKTARQSMVRIGASRCDCFHLQKAGAALGKPAFYMLQKLFAVALASRVGVHCHTVNFPSLREMLT